MSQSHWRTTANQVCRDVLSELPADADEKTCRRALSAAYPFCERKMHPYKIWRSEVRLQMEARFPHLKQERAQREMAKRGVVTRGQLALLEVS